LAKINDTFAHDVYRFLIKPLRDSDDGGTLESYVGGVQSAFEQTQSDQSALLDLFDIDDCPAWALDYLLWIVGWTKPLEHITEDLTDAQKRKVIRLSAQLWKQKGTPIGIKNAVRLFTGRDVVFWSWFYMRIEVDQSGVWQKGIGGVDPWLVGQTYGDWDEYLSFCWIMDEDSPDKELIHDIVQMNRPMGEAIQVCYAQLVDDFQLGLSKWVVEAGTDPVWDQVNYRMTVPVSSILRANVLGISGLDSFTWTASLTLTDADTQLYLHMFWDGDASPDDTLMLQLDNDALTLLLVQRIATADTTLATGNLALALPVDDPIGIVVHVTEATAVERRVRVSIDGVELIDHTMTPANSEALLDGAIGIDADPSSYTFHVDNVILFGHPLYCDLIEAGDETRDAEPVASVPIWTDATPAGWRTWGIGIQWFASG
jgi:phage tail-like protein